MTGAHCTDGPGSELVHVLVPLDDGCTPELATLCDPRAAEGAASHERAAVPDARLDLERALGPAEDVQSVRLAEALRARPAKAWCRREHERRRVVRERLEGVALDGGALVDVPSEDHVGPGSRESTQGHAAVLGGELPGCAPGCAGEVVMADDDPQRGGRRVGEHGLQGVDPGDVEHAALVTPWTRRVEAAGYGR